ncbi:hypothetical protein OUZ56_009799 [Daphnia magna]|uniref:Uncharacterized protein n=1 Tax=Daphnia magna TaxID=35525 RepID=A0ABR0AGX3_9CRUS|nr:hypothetical protein OUZ56_009799 [Daphnia magna]
MYKHRAQLGEMRILVYTTAASNTFREQIILLNFKPPVNRFYAVGKKVVINLSIECYVLNHGDSFKTKELSSQVYRRTQEFGSGNHIDRELKYKS